MALGINFITMGAVIYYACVAKGQLDEMRASVELSRRALDANERAYVVGLRAHLVVAPTGVIEVRAALVNYGKSPAFLVRHRFERTNSYTAPKIQVPLGAGSTITLAPNAADPTPTTTVFGDIPAPEVQSILSGKKPFVVWLRVKYSDPFSESRDTLECWVYDWMRKMLWYCPGGQYHH